MGVRAIPDLLAELASRSIELRVMPSLWRLRDQVALSTLRFSINRFSNAAPPEDGYVSRLPVQAGLKPGYTGLVAHTGL